MHLLLEFCNEELVPPTPCINPCIHLFIRVTVHSQVFILSGGWVVVIAIPILFGFCSQCLHRFFEFCVSFWWLWQNTQGKNWKGRFFLAHDFRVWSDWVALFSGLVASRTQGGEGRMEQKLLASWSLGEENVTPSTPFKGTLPVTFLPSARPYPSMAAPPPSTVTSRGL